MLARGDGKSPMTSSEVETDPLLFFFLSSSWWNKALHYYSYDIFFFLLLNIFFYWFYMTSTAYLFYMTRCKITFSVDVMPIKKRSFSSSITEEFDKHVNICMNGYGQIISPLFPVQLLGTRSANWFRISFVYEPNSIDNGNCIYFCSVLNFFCLAICLYRKIRIYLYIYGRGICKD